MILLFGISKFINNSMRQRSACADSISRSVFHTGTNDFEGKRQGNRVVSLGEKPFYNPASKSRREALFRAL